MWLQVKALALQETEAAATILAKAERLIKTLAEQRQRQQQQEQQQVSERGHLQALGLAAGKLLAKQACPDCA